MIAIRTIAPEDAVTFWSLRLQALKNNPEAFSSNYEDSLAKTMDTVKARIQVDNDNFIIGAFDGETAVGMVGFVRERTRKLSHKGRIWGTYVSPDYRGQGLGRKLLDEVISRASRLEGLTQINLGVYTVNESAMRLYEAAGFRAYGLEQNAMKHNGRFFDEQFMVYTSPEVE
jgi:RimJ/RimL family protein N-acetyltransferase